MVHTEQFYTKCGTWTTCTRNNGKLVKTASLWALPHLYQINLCGGGAWESVTLISFLSCFQCTHQLTNHL